MKTQLCIKNLNTTIRYCKLVHPSESTSHATFIYHIESLFRKHYSPARQSTMLGRVCYQQGNPSSSLSSSTALKTTTVEKSAKQIFLFTKGYQQPLSIDFINGLYQRPLSNICSNLIRPIENLPLFTIRHNEWRIQ